LTGFGRKSLEGNPAVHYDRFRVAIPDFQSVMRPLMEFISDGKEHSMRDALDQLANHFKLTEEERKRLLPSGQQELFTNRVAWAKTHLRMAGLVEATARGVFRITPRGREVLRSTQDRIDLRVLQKQPGYLEARGRKKEKPAPNGETGGAEADQTPEELMEESFQALRESLGHEVLSKLKKSSPAFFERLVVELLVRMGYGGTRKDAGQAIGKSGDEGIDGIIKEDRLGLDTIYIQAKKWEQTVSRPEIQKFAGALQGFRARKGIFITTSDFSKEAIDYSARIDSKIVLIDGEQLWNLMIDFGIGVSTTATYEVKRIDNDYFSEEMG
jgi:restriction system protein